ncbi:MAG: DMT family transporter [Rhodobacteraceae bacterium]|nr:DMT family transporter [Paracoccaceae bacterium]
MIRQGSLSGAPRPAAPEQKSIPPLAWAGIGLLGLIWGGSFLSNALLLRELGVLTTVAERVTLAALALWVYVFAARLPVPRSLIAWRDFTIMGVLNVALPFSLIVWAQQFVASGLASIINAGTAIFGVLIAAIVFADERLTTRKATGVLLGFTGVATAIGLEALLAFDLSSKGQIALIGATISYGFGGAFARARLTGFKPEVAAAGMLTGSAALMVPYALIAEGAPPLAMSLTTWAALAYLGSIPSRTLSGDRDVALPDPRRLEPRREKARAAAWHVRSGQNPRLQHAPRRGRLVPLLHRLPHRHPLHGRIHRR